VPLDAQHHAFAELGVPDALAELHGIAPADMAARTAANFATLFQP
jgi:Tat protein secretion system quality control protein TatD with DNase activity